MDGPKITKYQINLWFIPESGLARDAGWWPPRPRRRSWWWCHSRCERLPEVARCADLQPLPKPAASIEYWVKLRLLRFFGLRAGCPGWIVDLSKDIQSCCPRRSPPPSWRTTWRRVRSGQSDGFSFELVVVRNWKKDLKTFFIISSKPLFSR